MKFITLTRSENNPVLINTMMITALVDLGPIDQLFNTQVYTMGGSHLVKENIEEIQKLIKETEKTTTITWETGPR